MHQLLRWISFSAALALLSGCLDIDQKVTLHKNELTYKAEIKVDAKLAALSAKPGTSFCSSMDIAKNEGIQVETKELAVGGDVICQVTAKGKPENFTSFSTSDNSKSEIIRIRQLDKNTYRVESTIDFDSKSANMAGMENVFASMFAGRNVSWSISAPKILESNGAIAEDKKSVSWTVPMSVAFKTPQHFYAVIQEESSWFDRIFDFFKSILNAVLGLFTTENKSTSAGSHGSAVEATSQLPVAATIPVTINGGSPPASVSEVQVPAPQSVDASNVTSASNQASNPFTPSFDCAKATSGQERLICSDRELSLLDVELNKAYANARLRSADSAALKSEQREWVKSVQRSCSDKACLTTAYQNRIAYLSR